MGYVSNAPYFCMAMEMVDDFSNKDIFQREQAREHLMDMAGKYRAAAD